MSIFVIVWGTKRRDDTLGKVVDTCPICDGAREFIIQEHYQVSHIYAIPLGPWRLITASRTCTACDRPFPCIPSRYDAIVPVAAANALPFMDLLRQTNSALAAHFQDASGEASHPPGAAGAVFDSGTTHRTSVTVPTPADYAVLQQLYAKLERHKETRHKAAAFFDQLRDWRILAPVERQRLTERIDGFDADQTRLDEAREFLRTLTRNWPKSIGWLLAIVLAVVTAALVVPLAFLPLRQDQSGAVALYLVCLGIGLLVCCKLSLKAARAAWIRTHCLAYATRMSVSREAIAQVLESPVNQSWDRETIWTIIHLRPLKAAIDRYLESLPSAAPVNIGRIRAQRRRR